MVQYVNGVWEVYRDVLGERFATDWTAVSCSRAKRCYRREVQHLTTRNNDTKHVAYVLEVFPAISELFILRKCFRCRTWVMSLLSFPSTVRNIPRSRTKRSTNWLRV